jgi:tRNA threonylcarbamoyladenosine biosynthesis protein TsaB
MTLLALDTTADRCAVLLRGDGADVVLEEPLARGHDARLAPLVAEAFSQADLKPNALLRVVVAAGPGSFTGARVGVAFARGLALALKIPAVGVTNLDALALTAGGGSGLLVAAHDAGRGDVVWRAYRDGAPAGEPVCVAAETAAAAIDALREGETVRLAGSGAAALAGAGRVDLGVRRFALAALADLGAVADPSIARAEPFYHRPPDAAPYAPRRMTPGPR